MDKTLSRRVMPVFFGMDLAFKLPIFPAFALLVHGQTLRQMLGGFLVIVLPAMALFHGVLWLLLRPIDRWIRSKDAGALPSAAKQIHRLPNFVCWAWSAHWVTLFVTYTAVGHLDISRWALGCFLGAMLLGPLPLAHALMLWLVSPDMRRMWQTSAERPPELSGAPQRIRFRLSAYNFALCMAPSFYIASIAIAAPPDIHLAVALAFVPVALFGVLCALLFADGITRRLDLVNDVVSTITRKGDVSSAGSVPIIENDEVGTLSAHTNEMIDRLKRAAAERAAMAESLAALNRTLERRVEEAIKARNAVELELHQAQKLKAIGRLSGGVAHEINTPVQFINDSVTFIRDAWGDVMSLLAEYRTRGRLEEKEQSTDVAYLEENVPKSVDRALEGIERVAHIVRSLKAFAAAEQSERIAVSLNEAIDTTLTVARNEYRYTADVETDFGELTPVLCNPADINQALLNLLINAAQAIEEVVRGTQQRGRIRVSTRQEGDDVVVRISDTGVGISDENRSRIFEPFFTTKEMGKGSGQGLALARSAIVDRHGGQISFESKVGEGTTFTLRLPTSGKAIATAA